MLRITCEIVNGLYNVRVYHVSGSSETLLCNDVWTREKAPSASHAIIETLTLRSALQLPETVS